MSTRRVPADRQLSWEPGRDVSAALLDEQSRGDSVPEGGTLRSLTMTVALSQAPPAPLGPWGQPTFRNCKITSREQNQLVDLFPSTFNAIIRAHLSLNEVTKEKPK